MNFFCTKINLLFLSVLSQISFSLAIKFENCKVRDDKIPSCLFSSFKDYDNLSFCFMPEPVFNSLSLKTFDLYARPVVHGRDEIKVRQYNDQLKPNQWNYLSISYKIQPLDAETSYREYNYTVNNNRQHVTRTEFPVSQIQSSYFDLVFDGPWKGSRNFIALHNESKLTNCNDEISPDGGVEETSPDGDFEETSPDGDVDEVSPGGGVEEDKNNEKSYTTITIGFIVMGIAAIVLCFVTAFLIYKKIRKTREPNFEEIPREDSELEAEPIPLREMKSQGIKVAASDSEEKQQPGT